MDQNKTKSFRDLYLQLYKVLSPERSFYYTSIIYGLGVSLLTLAIPISVQALVNTVTFGVLLQPLVVLSILLLSLLIFSGVLKALQTFIIEKFQQHFFARTASTIATNLLLADPLDLEKKNGVELTNRYFDVMTVKKSATLLITDGVAMVLQLLVGMILLAFYHPYFLIFDILLVVLILVVWRLFGKRAILTAIDESKQKYKVAGWLEEIARVNLLFKSDYSFDTAISKSDKVINNYLKERNKHFRLLFMQTVLLLLTYAVMSALILGLGGFLVIKQQLSLGQLVAAELVVTVIMSNFLKFSKYLEAFYDLIAATDKLYMFNDLKAIDLHSQECIPAENQMSLEFKNVFLTSDDTHTFCLNYKFEKGKNYKIRANSLSSRSVFTEMLYKICRPDTGEVYLGEVPYEKLGILNIKEKIAILERPTIFEGTIDENLRLHKPDITNAKINEVLEVVHLDINKYFKDGINTKLKPSGYPMWPSQVIRLELARAILSEPDIIVMTESFDQIELKRRQSILKYLSDKKITVILFTNRESKVQVFDHYLFLGFDGFVECDNEAKLLEKELHNE